MLNAYNIISDCIIMLLEVWNYIKIYLLHTILIVGLAYATMRLTPIDLVKFAGVTFASLMLIEKIILKGMSVVPSGGTVREQLVKACPKPQNAGNMIVPGTEATYDNYLFSACEAAGTCDGNNPDEISAGIIAKTESCGAWDLKSTGLSYGLDKGWTKASDCKQYTDDAAYLPDACLQEIWSKTGCTNITAADQNYKRWKKGTKKEVTRDMNSWATLQDTTHRTLCYGADQTKWPQPPPPPPPPVNCATVLDTDTNVPIQCQQQIWANSGCTTDVTANSTNTTWWSAQTQAGVKADMKAWATETDSLHRTRCYGPDQTNWPQVPPPPPKKLGNPNWTKLPQGSGLAQVSRDGNIFCSVGTNNTIWCADQNIDTNPNWFQLPGALTHVSLSNGRLYGVNAAGNIWYASNYKNPQWVQVPGVLSQVSLDGSVVCGIDSGGNTVCADQNIETQANWFYAGTSINPLTYVSVKNGRLYGANATGSIFYADNYKTGKWVLIPGSLKQVEFVDNNTVCGVNSSNAIFCADTTIDTTPNWTTIPGALTQITGSGGNLTGVGTDQALYAETEYY
jgi:hypothetical protein